MELSKNLETLRRKIAEAAVRSGRRPEEIALLAVTKTFPLETIQRAYDMGLRDFGENRVQEALGKMARLPANIRWHLIGQLQTNKINKVIGKFALIHSVDSIDLAQALSKRINVSPQDVLLEVNTSGENTKSGIRPGETLEAAAAIARLPNLRLGGLMTVGPLTENGGRVRDAFKRLKELFEEGRKKEWAGQGFSVLSMGMSGDFETAIEEGSTMVRIGSALFGTRG